MTMCRLTLRGSTLSCTAATSRSALGTRCWAGMGSIDVEAVTRTRCRVLGLGLLVSFVLVARSGSAFADAY